MKRVMTGAGQITLGDQLRRINRITLVVALGIVAVIIIASSFTINLISLVESSQVKAKVLAENASASLMFQDARSARNCCSRCTTRRMSMVPRFTARTRSNLPAMSRPAIAFPLHWMP